MGLFSLLFWLWSIYMVGRVLRTLLKGVPPNVPPGAGSSGPRRPRSPFESPFSWYYEVPPQWPPRQGYGRSQQPWPGQGQAQSQDPGRPQAPRIKTPHEVLEVSTQATSSEIRQAYQKLILQYHPDRVGSLGADLRELAERRTKEINIAYNTLKRR